MSISGHQSTDMAMMMIAVTVIRHFCHVISDQIDLFLHQVAESFCMMLLHFVCFTIYYFV